MKKLNKFILIIFTSLFIIGWSGKKVEKYEDTRYMFGTYIKIMVYSENKKLANEAIDVAFKEIKRIDENYNSKMKDSLLGKINSSDDKKIEIDDELSFIINSLSESYELSKSKYDVTISPLMELWGFTEGGKVEIPNDEEIKKIINQIDFSKVKIENNILTYEDPVKKIDAGSFLKGYALLKAKEKMVELGIDSAFLTSISSIETIGTKPGNKPWRVGIQNPENPEDLLGVIELNDSELSVSGDYQTFVEIDGKKYHHIIDKDTGYPVRHIKMVAVLSKNNYKIDSYSTAFFLMPIQEVIDFVESTDDLEVMIVDKDMKIHKTDRFKLLVKK